MNENIWSEWRDLIIYEFECRLTAISTKGPGVTPGRKGLTALFFLIKDLGLSAAYILPEVIKTMKEKDVKDARRTDILPLDEDQYDAIAMMGHRIGILENSDDMERYFQDVHRLMKPDGQMLFTSLDASTMNETKDMSYRKRTIPSGRSPAENGIQSRYGNLMGPFFGLFNPDTELLRTHAAATNWNCAVLHRQDNDNYVAWLRHEECPF